MKTIIMPVFRIIKQANTNLYKIQELQFSNMVKLDYYTGWHYSDVVKYGSHKLYESEDAAHDAWIEMLNEQDIKINGKTI